MLNYSNNHPTENRNHRQLCTQIMNNVFSISPEQSVQFFFLKDNICYCLLLFTEVKLPN